MTRLYNKCINKFEASILGIFDIYRMGHVIVSGCNFVASAVTKKYQREKSNGSKSTMSARLGFCRRTMVHVQSTSALFF